MNAVITVIGQDRVGITAQVSGFLANAGINILSISQTIMDEYFTMMMKVDLSGSKLDKKDVVKGLDQVGENLGVRISLVHEEVLKSMHRI